MLGDRDRDELLRTLDREPVDTPTDPFHLTLLVHEIEAALGSH